MSDKDDVKKENKVDLYLDSNDYVIKVALNEGVTDYAYVIDVDEDGGKLFTKGTPYAKLLLTDGTVVEAELKYDDYSTISTLTGLEDEFANCIVEYSVNSKDVYKLTVMKNGDDKAEKTDLASDSQAITIEAGKAKMTLGAKTIYADSKTIFLTDDGDDNYKAYVGYDSVSDLNGSFATGDANAAYAYYCKSGSVANVVYVLNTTGSSDDIVFLLAKECSGKITAKDGDDYWECPAVVNGEIVTVKLDKSIKNETKVLLKSVIYANEDEEIINFEKSKEYSKTGTDDNYYFTGEVTKKLTNGNLTIDGNSYRVSNDVQVFLYSDEITSSSESAIAEGDNGHFVINDGQIVTIFYKENDGSADEEEDVDQTGSVKVEGVQIDKTEYAEGTGRDTIADGLAAGKAYIFTNEKTINALINQGDSIGGEPEDNLFFLFRGHKAKEEITLVIRSAKGEEVYRESVTAGDAPKTTGIFYVQVTGKNVGNAGYGPMQKKALEAGEYSWTITSTNVKESGTFTITK